MTLNSPFFRRLFAIYSSLVLASVILIYFSLQYALRRRLIDHPALAGLSPSELQNLLVQQGQLILPVLGLVTLLVLLAALLLAFKQAARLEAMTTAAQTIAAGDFARRVHDDSRLGLGKLAEVINQLARNSAARVSDITADRNRLAAIFAGMVEGVIDVDQDQKILHMNEAAARLLQVNLLSCKGKRIWEAVRHHEITRALDQVIATQSEISLQLSLSLSASGADEKTVLNIYAAALSDDQGKPIGAIVVLHDISELRQLERIRTDFVANASHELKTPITAIRGLSESVIDDPAVDRETLLHFMQRIHAQSLRLSQLVGDLMTISRLEAGQGEEDFSLINMQELVKRSAQAAESLVAEKRQQLRLELQEETIEVYGDRQNLSQLLDNLVDNAIKYTPEEGEICIALKSDGEDMLLQVTDTGIGISPQYQKRIFERFYRVDKARSRSLGGTGLGLSIVKNIADKHKGRLAVESYPERGSSFSFRMKQARS